MLNIEMDGSRQPQQAAIEMEMAAFAERFEFGSTGKRC